LPYPDIAEFLKARMLADLREDVAACTPGISADADEPRHIEALEAHIAKLQDAVAEAHTMGERRRREAESAAERVAALQAEVATLTKAVADAEALGEQHRQEAEASAERAVYLVTELIDVTSELTELRQRKAS
jgi:chromosome segregation ATPase